MQITLALFKLCALRGAVSQTAHPFFGFHRSHPPPRLQHAVSLEGQMYSAGGLELPNILYA
jgi:hypothetical protein